MMDQDVLDRAVRIATRAAMNGAPLSRIVWIPPQTAASDPGGIFVVAVAERGSVADGEPW